MTTVNNPHVEDVVLVYDTFTADLDTALREATHAGNTLAPFWPDGPDAIDTVVRANHVINGIRLTLPYFPDTRGISALNPAPTPHHIRAPGAPMPENHEPPYRRVDSNPWQDPAGPGSTRRLIEFSFQCPLCDGVHTPQFYFTLPTPDLEAYAQAMDAFMKGPYALDTALRVARQTHDSDGDLADLITRLPGRTVAMGILNHRILEESEYTCDFCGQTFSTIAELRIHLGVEPHTAPDQDNVQPRCQSRSN